MLVCVECKKEMRCDKNSVGADFGNGHVYPGDRFRCPNCDGLVILTNSNPAFDPAYNYCDEYLKMKQEEPKDKHEEFLAKAAEQVQSWPEWKKASRGLLWAERNPDKSDE